MSGPASTLPPALWSCMAHYCLPQLQLQWSLLWPILHSQALMRIQQVASLMLGEHMSHGRVCIRKGVGLTPPFMLRELALQACSPPPGVPARGSGPPADRGSSAARPRGRESRPTRLQSAQKTQHLLGTTGHRGGRSFCRGCQGPGPQPHPAAVRHRPGLLAPMDLPVHRHGGGLCAAQQPGCGPLAILTLAWGGSCLW